MESEIQEKTNHTELLMQLYLDIKELKDDWTEIVEEGIDIDNIMRTYKFYVKYIEKIDNGDLSFDDYVLFYIQDRSEYAAKCLLEKIWEEMNILLENVQICVYGLHVSSSQALMREPATVSFTSYHFPVSTLPGRVTNRFLLSPIVCSIACCVLPSQPKFSQQ